MRTITITFANGTTLDALSFNKSQRYFQKADRETATFTFNKFQATFEQLRNLFRNNVEEIEVHTVVTDDDTGEIIQDDKVYLKDFVILSKLVFHEDTQINVLAAAEETTEGEGDDPEPPTPPDPNQIPLYTVEIAQLSLLEKNQRIQTAMVEENTVAIIELAEIIG